MACLWTEEECGALLAGVRQALLHGPPVIPWEHIEEELRVALPGRTLAACGVIYRKRAGEAWEEEEAEEGGPKVGGHGKEWTKAELAVLANAVQSGLARAELRTVNWSYVGDNTHGLLAGRSLTAMGAFWRSGLSKTPAAKAMLREVAQELSAKEQQRLRQGRAKQQQQQQQQQTPFHMLHSLLESGAIDAETLSVCWRATAEAMR